MDSKIQTTNSGSSYGIIIIIISCCILLYFSYFLIQVAMFGLISIIMIKQPSRPRIEAVRVYNKNSPNDPIIIYEEDTMSGNDVESLVIKDGYEARVYYNKEMLNGVELRQIQPDIIYTQSLNILPMPINPNDVIYAAKKV